MVLYINQHPQHQYINELFMLIVPKWWNLWQDFKNSPVDVTEYSILFYYIIHINLIFIDVFKMMLKSLWRSFKVYIYNRYEKLDF